MFFYQIIMKNFLVFIILAFTTIIFGSCKSKQTSIEDAAYKVAPENTIRSGVGYNTYNYRINLDIEALSIQILCLSFSFFKEVEDE